MADDTRRATGEAVFIRTDTPDYAEAVIPFASLEEMVLLCTAPRPNLALERVVIHAVADAGPLSLTLGFIAASKGQRPGPALLLRD